MNQAAIEVFYSERLTRGKFSYLSKSRSGVKEPREHRIGDEPISIINACDSFRACCWRLSSLNPPDA